MLTVPLIRDIIRDKFHLDSEPLCVHGCCVTSITAELLIKPDDEIYENIIQQIGSNNCTNAYFDADIFKDNYEILVKTTKSICENVVVSAMCPRLDDKFCNIRIGNYILSKLCSNDNCHWQ